MAVVRVCPSRERIADGCGRSASPDRVFNTNEGGLYCTSDLGGHSVRHREREQKRDTTFDGGSLGSRIDEERSQLR